MRFFALPEFTGALIASPGASAGFAEPLQRDPEATGVTTVTTDKDCVESGQCVMDGFRLNDRLPVALIAQNAKSGDGEVTIGNTLTGASDRLSRRAGF